MALLVAERWLRVTVEGEVVRTTPDVAISASLDQLNRVCALTYAEQPEDVPADGDSVLVELVDSEDGVAYDLFGGVIDGGPKVESEPFGLIVRAVDQLADLRIAHTGADLDFTGMTVKEAKMAVFDYCGLTYDPDDLVDVDHELGALEPVKWLSDGNTTGAQIIGEIDRVFGLTTQTIGNNRIISFRYELLPEDATGLYRTFTKGVSIDFRAHGRDRGSRNDIQTIWIVRGVTHPFNDETCSETPWAKAVHGTARVGRSRRVPEATDQSDLIQDEALAEWVARQRMQQTSGIPDTGDAGVITSRNLHPGTKIAIDDRTYGISARPRYFCTTRVEINGLRTDLTLRAGPPGNEGTVTHGVDRVCNDTHTDGDIPGSFDPPDVGFPPLDDGTIGDFPFPDVDVDDPAPPEPDEPFMDCTDSGELVDVIANPWRTSGDIGYRADGLTTLGLNTLTNGTIFHNVTVGAKTADDDVIYGTGETVCVSGTFIFPCSPSEADPSRLNIELRPVSGSPVAAKVEFVATPGYEPRAGYTRGIRAGSEHEGAVFSPNRAPGVCHGIEANNGGAEGTPVPLDTEIDFSICFDIGSSPQRTYFSSSVGSGFQEDVNWKCGLPPFTPPDPCDHGAGHKLVLELLGSSSITADPSCPFVEIRNLAIGSATCVPNPDFVEPDRTGGRG